MGDELIELLQSVDYRLFNLECPIIKKKTTSSKWGTVLERHISTTNFYKK